MTKKPKVHAVFYAYKNKNLKESVSSLIENASDGIDLQVTVYDQNPLIRDDFFNGLKSCRYIHIFWDHIISPTSYINSGVSLENSDYTLVTYGRTIMKKDWDIELINIAQIGDCIISGKNKTILKPKNVFYFDKNIHETTRFTISNYIDRDMVFGKTSILKKFQFPTYLKHVGVEEFMSLLYFTCDIKVYSTPGDFYSLLGADTIETTYTTFSKIHGYNEFVDLAKTGKNSHLDITNNARTIKDFEDFHGISFDALKRVPFPVDDVAYNPHESPFDSVDQKKFMTKVNYIA